MTEREPMNNNTNTTLADAIAAARAGHRDEAARLFRQIVTADPFNVDAWIWLGGIAPEPQDQRTALEQAVRIAPQNQRAQQGLAWLRQSRPELFDEPQVQRATPSYQQPTVTGGAHDDHRAAIYPMTSEPRINEAPTQAAIYPLPTETQPRVNEAATQAFAVPPRAEPQFVAQPAQTDRISTLPSTSYQEPAHVSQFPNVGTTDRMAVVPPPTSAAAAEPVERYESRGNVSRWLLLLIWLFSFGAIATIAALLIVQPARFEPLVQPLLAQFGMRLLPEYAQSTAFVTALVMIGVAVIDFMVILGMLFRGRWAWVVNLLIALLVTAGTIALVATAFTLLPSMLTSTGQMILGGLAAFTLIYLILSFTSRRAFFRRRIQSYGG